VDHNFRKRLLLANAGVVLVIALSATTAVVALRTTSDQLEQARQIDGRLAHLDRLRNDARELAASARRYMISLDLEEQQRVLAIVDAMRGKRQRLDARSSFAKGPVLEADLDEFIAALLNAMSFRDDDPIVRLARFEDELARIRSPLAMTFDAIVAGQRDRREALRSAHTLSRGAQWGVGVASLLGVVLALGAMVAVLRRPRAVAAGGPGVVAASEPRLLR
jgi:hypothetical protein